MGSGGTMLFVPLCPPQSWWSGRLVAPFFPLSPLHDSQKLCLLCVLICKYFWKCKGIGICSYYFCFHLDLFKSPSPSCSVIASISTFCLPSWSTEGVCKLGFERGSFLANTIGQDYIVLSSFLEQHPLVCLLSAIMFSKKYIYLT